MASVLFWLAIVTLFLVLATTIEFALGNRSIARLADVPPLSTPNVPKVSIIVAARNEARKIEHGLQSVLAQDHRNTEFIVVDDRSTDETGRILDRMAGADPRLHVVHITDLPGGWLGKTHALHIGAERATGELLLFTDADVVMERTVVGRAVSYLQDRQLDHLAVGPQMHMPGTLLSMFGGAFVLFFGLYAKPWKARDPKSPRHIGVGAFNLIRAEVYRAIGGHQAIAMRPDDDMKLGKLIKKHGFRQDISVGAGLMTVEWYGSLGELIRGLEKNTFAGVEYNLAIVVAASIAQLLVFLWPLAALLLTHGATWWLNLAIVALLAALYMDNAHTYGAKRWHCVGGPVTALLFQYIIWRATLKTLWNNGIDWRGTHYSLQELKANKV
ncbi:MAG TPA: glycosyltransferase family 2 protein [Verrucomicrobiae bacterium]|nr:glycosyltransferase family 2 protein [Verrucomicrobiae bacterium]